MARFERAAGNRPLGPIAPAYHDTKMEQHAQAFTL